MMNRSFFRALALTLCLTMLCVIAAGCQSRPLPPVDPATDVTTTTVTRPTVVLEDAGDSVFLGTWNVSAQKSPVTSITFRENGMVEMVLNGSTLAGAFYVESETEVTLNVSSSDMKATYTVDGDTITLTTESDVWTLTKPE